MQKTKPFRIDDWWVGKASLLMGLVYLFSLHFSISFGSFWIWASCSIVTIVGFATLGYLINDFFDQEKDALVGKKNFLLHKSSFQKAFYFCISLFVLFAPWYFLPYDWFTVSLMTLQFICYFIYSAPPFRLKEKGTSALVIDSFYAHAIPALMAAYTYSLIAHQEGQFWFFFLLVVWQILVGIRNILLHQKVDLDLDKKNDTKTFLQNTHPDFHSPLIKKVKAFEVIFLLAMIFFLSVHNRLLFLPFVVVCIALFFHLLSKSEVGYSFFFPNLLYEHWLPLSFILILSLGDWRYGFLFLIHILLFSGFFLLGLIKKIPFSHYLSVLINNIKLVFRFLAIKFKTFVNWSIYLLFRLVGVDLKKEKTDAIGYLSKKLNREK